jgi:hypothetical protein
MKPLSCFEPAVKFVLKSDYGTCRVCRECEFLKALEDKSKVSFNIITEKFDVLKFENDMEVIKYFKEIKNYTDEEIQSYLHK